MIESTELYGGEVICEFDSARHQYRIVNKGRRFKVPSVTRICSIVDKSGPLMYWALDLALNLCRGAIAPGAEYAESYLDAVFSAARKEHQNAKSEAGKNGRRVHEGIEAYLKQTGPTEVPPSQDFVDWIASFRVEEVERRTYSRRHRYSGTFDALGRSPSGDLILLDWKTSKSIYPEFRLQTAAYCAAYEEEFPDKRIAGRYLVRITEDGAVEPHYYPRSTLRKDFAAFLGAKTLFDRLQAIEKEARKEK